MGNKLDINKLTLGEVDFIERYSKLPLAKFSDPETPKTRLMIAMATVVKRRDGNPQYSTTEAEALTLGEAQDIVQLDGIDDDDDAGDETGSGSAAGE